jgi:hypothetical protein
VELVALLPLALLALAIAWQVVLAGQATSAAGAAARAAARASAVGGDPTAAARAHLPAELEHDLRVQPRGAAEVEVSVRIPRVVHAISVGRATAKAAFAPQG